MVQDPLAMQLLEGKFGEGDLIEVDARGGGLDFKKVAARAEQPVAS